MGDRGERRAAQKARTRERILGTAQALFAEQGFEAVTLALVAAGAQVSVQTVFNHFSSKEELFFTDRIHWVAGPALAVGGRSDSVSATEALHRHLVDRVDAYVRAASTTGHRALVEVLAASPALLAHERSLHEEGVERLAESLAEAWGCAGGRAIGARVTAAVWLGAVRAILLDLRDNPPSPGDGAAVDEAVALTERVLDDLDAGLSIAGSDSPRAA